MKTDEELGGPWADTLPAEAPVVHRNLEAWAGGRKLTTLTRDHLDYWLGKLWCVRGGSFLTVARVGQAGFIQTCRNSETDHLIEVHSGNAEGEYLAATVHDVTEVGQLLWDWLENDRQRLDAVAWEHRTLD